MSKSNYKYLTNILSGVGVALIIFNIYYFFIWRNVGISYYIEKIIYLPKDTALMSRDYIDQVEQYANLNKALNTIDIVFLGDSHTKSFNVHEYFPSHNVLNRGICSDTTVGLLKRLEKNVNNIEINKLFILIGYNDLPYRSNEEILANIEMVVNEVRARNIYVQSLLPVEAKRKDINHRIKDINNRLKKICESKKVEYVDLHSHFIDASGGLSNSYSLDGIHLNGDGYRLWKELIEKRIK